MPGTLTKNYEGQPAYQLPPAERIIQMTISGFMQGSFYKGASEHKNELNALIETVGYSEGFDFIYKLSKWLRNEHNIRETPLYILAFVACNVDESARDNVRKAIANTLSRMDEPAKLIAHCKHIRGSMRNIPRSVYRGIADYLSENLNQYTASKYKRGADGFSLADVIKLSHFKPKDITQAMLAKAVIEDTLPPAETWETKISTQGSYAETWNEAAKKMGFMALLRNLRNFVKHDAKEAIQIAVDKLNNKQEVLNSKQLPFRFFSALKALVTTPTSYGFYVPSIDYTNSISTPLHKALANALEYSLANLPDLGRTLCSADVSGSMNTALSQKSTVTYMDIATLFTAAYAHANPKNSVASVFGNTFKTVELSKNSSIFNKMEKLTNTQVGLSTNGYLVIQYLHQNNISKDTVLIFTDTQLYGGNSFYGDSSAIGKAWDLYRKQVNARAKLIIFDLSSYGNTPVQTYPNNVICLGGWSDRAMEYLQYNITGFGQLVKEVRNYDDRK